MTSGGYAQAGWHFCLYSRESPWTQYQPTAILTDLHLHLLKSWVLLGLSQFCKPGVVFYVAEFHHCPSKSRVNVRCAVRAVTRTKTHISEPRTCAASPIS